MSTDDDAVDAEVTGEQEPSRPTNPFAGPAVGLALFAVFLGSFARLGAALGLVAVVFGICGAVRAERNDVGLAGSLFGAAVGLIAVLWAATAFVST